jgi:peptidoglycan/LPS O-acetylase OafA/YrhL
LRAVAILLIVAYHARIPGFSGGFIGVDVFFVLSGYLITRHLLAEAGETRRIRFGQFYARRIRRLVPGLAILVIGALVASALIVDPFDMREISKEGAAAALYVSNILFAQNAQNYFAPSVTNSPFLHTWSLGVEEQFYLFWPFLVAGVLIATRHRPHRMRRAAIAVLLLVLALSFALNLQWTADGSSWSFFSLPTRAWEFAAGGLLAALPQRALMPKIVHSLVSLVGFGMLAAATLLFSDTTAYPGLNAAVPVVATAALVYSGRSLVTSPSSPVVHILCTRPMQWIGGLSYSWYLWHWPFIVLTVLALNNGGTPVRTAAAIASLGAAYLASRFVENPLRFSRRMVGSVRRTFSVGLVFTVASLAVAGGTWEYAVHSSPASFASEMAKATKVFFPQCSYLQSREGARYCLGGDTTSHTSVALVGDSHAGTWFNVMSQVSSRLGVRLVLVAEPGCPFIPVEVKIPANGPLDTAQCLTSRQDGMRFLTDLRPRIVVLTEHDSLGQIVDSSGNVPSAAGQASLWKRAFASFLQQMKAEGIQPAVILDNPTLPEAPAECVSRTGSVAACESTRQTDLAPGKLLQQAELQVLNEQKDVPTFAPDSVLCNSSGCPLRLDGKLVYADTNHLLYGVTQIMEPELSSLLNSALAMSQLRSSRT